MKAVDLDILVLSPTPTAPLDYGNRKRIHAVCSSLKQRGARIHFLHYPSEREWRGAFPVEAMRQMQLDWENVWLVPPSKPLHPAAQGSDHTVDEWWDPAIGDFLKWLFSVRRFDAMMVNYTYLSKAFEYAPKGVYKILDTHDRFGGRREVLARLGIAPEFYHTTDEEEAKALERADLIWAIKPQEQQYFRRLVPRTVLTLPHSEQSAPVDGELSDGEQDALVIGLLGARNSINLANTRRFLEAAIPAFRAHFAPITICIAGSMCDDLEGYGGVPNVALMGRVESVEEFYRKIDVAVVPMDASTGLKIKAAEAIARSIPLVCNAHAFEGFPARHPFQVLESMEAIVDACIALSFEREKLDELRAATIATRDILGKKFADAVDRSLALTVAASSRIAFAVEARALSRTGLYLEHLLQAVEYLRWHTPVVIVCDEAPEKSVVDRLMERVGAFAKLIVHTGNNSEEWLRQRNSMKLRAAFSIGFPEKLIADLAMMTRDIFVQSDIVSARGSSAALEAFAGNTYRHCSIWLYGWNAEPGGEVRRLPNVEWAPVPFFQRRVRMSHKWSDEDEGAIWVLASGDASSLAAYIRQLVSRHGGSKHISWIRTGSSASDEQLGSDPYQGIQEFDLDSLLSNGFATGLKRPAIVLDLSPAARRFDVLRNIARQGGGTILAAEHCDARLDARTAGRAHGPVPRLLTLRDLNRLGQWLCGADHRRTTGVMPSIDESNGDPGWAWIWRKLGAVSHPK